MECMPVYRKVRKPPSNPMLPPPYCRSADRPYKVEHRSLKLDASDPSKLLLFVESLTDRTSKGLERKINGYVQREVNCKQSFIIFVSEKEAYIQVVGTKKLDLVRRCKLSESVVHQMYKECTASDTKIFDPLPLEFQDLMSQILEHKSAVLSFPVLTPSHPSVRLLLLCIVNPKQDIMTLHTFVKETFRFCLPILLNTSTSEEEAKTTKECQTLLTVARKLFSHLDDLTDLLREIMSEARNLTDAERCSLFLVEDNMLIAKVFDTTTEFQKEVKIPQNMGIVGHVAMTGELMNINNAYSHPLFYKMIDEKTGFKTRNILTFPIRNEEGIIGVAQLCNKREGDFTVDDEAAAMAFSIYCGLSIMHSLIYKRTREAQIKTQLCNELMMYHLKVDVREVNQLLQCKSPHVIQIDKLNFAPRTIPEQEMPCYILKMFQNLKLIEKFNLKLEALANFILHCKKGYRDTPYHNWVHAFCFTHFSYLVVKCFNLIERNFITELDALALLIGSLGHDVDHRGTTNSFQMKTGSPLANLYSSEGSVMERHHLSQTLCILNTDKCNILGSLDNQSYGECIDHLKTCILATDLAVHFQKIPKIKQMVELGYDRTDNRHKELLLSLIMTCADLSDQTKGWLAAKHVAQLVYAEFFVQGDLEKRMGSKPPAMMDREKASIPDLQIEFLNDVCLPAYSFLAKLFPPAEVFIETIGASVKCWEASKVIFERQCLKGNTSLEVLMSSRLESEVTREMEMNISEDSEKEESAVKSAMAGIVEGEDEYPSLTVVTEDYDVFRGSTATIDDVIETIARQTTTDDTAEEEEEAEEGITAE